MGENITAQGLLEQAGVTPGVVIPLPYGLSLELQPPFELEKFCDNEAQLQALRGLIGLCQGVLAYISEAGITFGIIIITVNIHYGIVYTVRDAGLALHLKRINPMFSFQTLYEEVIARTNLLGAMQSAGLSGDITFVPFEEIPNFYAELLDNGVVDESILNYESTMYSALSGLDELVASGMLEGSMG